MEKVWGRHVPTSSVVQGAYNASFHTSQGDTDADKEYEKVLQEVTKFEDTEGRRPRILVAKIGQDGHDRGAKVIASGFSDLGFDVDVGEFSFCYFFYYIYPYSSRHCLVTLSLLTGPLFQTPEEVAIQAIDSDVHVIGISSQAAAHKSLLPALKKELEEKGAGHMLVVAGGVIPPQDYDSLLHETQSCSAVFGPGTRVTDAAMRVLELIPREA